MSSLLVAGLLIAELRGNLYRHVGELSTAPAATS